MSGKLTEAQAVSDYKDGPCKWCGDPGDVYADTGRCERCDGDIFRCSICKEDQHVDDLCRHVFRDSNFEWAGGGAFSSETVKLSFLRLLQRMPAGFAPDLRRALRSGRFHTWLVAPLIGGGGTLEMHGMSYRDGRKWGDALINIGESDDAEDVADGYHWLVSLYDRKTRGANSTTVGWIDEWATSPAGRATLQAQEGKP